MDKGIIIALIGLAGTLGGVLLKHYLEGASQRRAEQQARQQQQAAQPQQWRPSFVDRVESFFEFLGRVWEFLVGAALVIFAVALLAQLARTYL